MYKTSNEYKEIIKSDEQRYSAYIELENGTKIYSNSDLSSLKLNDTIGNSIMGGFSPKIAKLSVLNDNKYNLTDKKFKLYIGLYLNNTNIEYIPQGTFIVSKPTDNDKGIKEITLEAKDLSYLFDIDYDRKKFENIFPCTMLAWTNAICAEIGVEFANSNFTNANIVLDRQPYTEDGATYRNVIAKIAEGCGCFAKIGKDDKLYYKNISSYRIDNVLTVKQVHEMKVKRLNTLKLWQLGKQKIKSVSLRNMFEQSKDDLKYGPLNSIVASRIVADDGSTTEDVYKRDEESIQKNGLCEYKIKENWVIDDKRDEFIINILKDLGGTKFNTGKIEVVADPSTDVGDYIQVSDVDSNTSFFMPIMDIEINIDNGISIIESSMPSKTETDYKSATSRKDKQRKTELKINKLDGEIKQIIQEQDEHSNKLTEIKSTVNSIEQQVESTYDFTKVAKGKSEVKLTDALDSNILKLTLNAENVSGAIHPKNSLFPKISLFPKKAGSAITLVVSRNSRYANKPLIYPKINLFPNKTLFPRSNPSMRKEFYFYIGNPLREYNNVHDQFVIEFDHDKGTCIAKVLRRIKKENGVYTIYNQAREEIIQEIDIELFKGTNYIYLKEYTNWEIEAEYMFNSELNKYYSTKVETNAKIKTMADEISLEVKQETDTDKLISKINMKPGLIDLTGLVTANENFKILEDGSVEAKNGKFSGNIYLDDGSEILGGKGLLSNLQFTSNGNTQVTSVGAYNHLGFLNNDMEQKNDKESIYIDVFIPDNFAIVSAILTLSIYPLRVLNNGVESGYGFAKNLRLYKSDMQGQMYANWNVNSGFSTESNEYYSEINNALANGGYTPDTSKKQLQTIASKDIANNLENGICRLKIESANNAPGYTGNFATDPLNCALQSCFASAKLNVYGYMKVESKEE